MFRFVFIAFAGLLAAFGASGSGILNNSNTNTPDDDASRAELWNQVQQDRNNQLPQSAIKKLTQIYDSAVSDQAWPAATNALCQRFMLEGSIDQPVYPHVIRKMQAFIPEAPQEIQPVLKTILAKWFYSYYQQNRWRFQQRTQTAVVPSEDFETWDLARLLNEIDEHFTSALQSADELKKIDITQWNDLIEKGTVSDAHRPTLYDFLAFEALDFYSLDEQFIRQQGVFEINADSPVFADSAEFLNWNPATGDEDSYLLKAVVLYQDLLRFHADDEDKTAWLDADLGRLEFAHRVANGSEADARYRSALQSWSDRHVDHPLSSMALGMLAESTQSEGDLVAALKIAQQGKSRFPKSVGGARCHNVIEQIQSKEIQLSTERVWNTAEATVDVKYRNTEKVWFRLVKFDYENWKKWGDTRTLQNFHSGTPELRALLGKQPAAKWSADLPKTDDYKERVEKMNVNIDVPTGCYALLCSTQETFELKNQGFNVVSIAEVWVSDLAAVIRNGAVANQVQVQVFNATTGEPLVGAKVERAGWVYDGRNSRSVELGTVETNSDGIVNILPDKPDPNGRRSNLIKLDISHGDQKLGVIQNAYASGVNNLRSTRQTVFFTDRAIYRPGQAIQFKGICVDSNQVNNEYKTTPNQKVTVKLYDANNQEVESKEFRTNEYGSFAGSFTAPRDRVTGTMRLNSSVSGATTIRVEEYKRPKFFVDIDKPSEAFRLDSSVKINGTATAYTGAAIDNSKVTWRVVRNVRYPQWYLWRCWFFPPQQSSAEIANGETTTGVDGKFEIAFPALPDKSVDREGDPVFDFVIYADVTDSAGETRSAQQSTSVGYTSLQASMKTDDQWLTTEQATNLKLTVSTLDGEGQSATGQLKIYRLTPPAAVQPARLSNYHYGPSRADAEPDMSDIKSWDLGEVAYEAELTSDEEGNAATEAMLEAGAYKAVFETKDPAGQAVKAELPLLVHDPTSDKFPIKIPSWFQAKTNSAEPGTEFVASWGTGYDKGRCYVEFEHRGEIVKSFWTKPGSTQTEIKFPIEEIHRGGVQMRITYIRENRLYSVNHRIDVPWSNKRLTLRWEHFVSKLTPGGRETWTAVVKGPDAENAVAEMVAGMYDASLDAFAPHGWSSAFSSFYQNYSRVNLQFNNSLQSFRQVHHYQPSSYQSASQTYRHFSHLIGVQGGYGSDGRHYGGARASRMLSKSSGAMEMADSDMEMDAAAPPMAEMRKSDSSMRSDKSEAGRSENSPAAPDVDLSDVAPRKNLQETAFFYPNLQVNSDGEVRIEFEIPEALTRWKFLGFAHDTQLRAGLLTDEMTTSKDLMVQPNPPRFLREGDQLEFSVKVSNQSDDPQAGTVKLTFADARTGESVDAEFDNQQLDQNFEIPAKQSKSLYWTVKVPDFVGALTYKAVGSTGNVSDGEEGFLPVLSKRILVTESLPLPIRGNETKTFNFERLELAGKSDTLQSQTLTVQVTSNPAWYAVMSLPYLMEYPHECSEQVFNRLYANGLGRHIVTSDPKIERIFDQWRNTPALDSPLEKNEDLRNVLIAESPWLAAGKKESQARRDVGILFEQNRLDNEMTGAMNKLTQMQLSDGAWPWFPGGQANDYITLYVMTGFGRLRHLGVEIDVAPAIKAADRLDWWIDKQYQELKRNDHLDRNNLSPTVCLYLYGRSFFLKDKPVDAKYKTAYDYYLGQGKQYWNKLGNRQSQGHLAIGLKRNGDGETPAAIMKSLSERSLQEDEMGMFWREGDLSWWWYKAPIETQALMIEAYDEVAKDAAKVEELKIWLLKQKQTQNWKTTKATADACYGLLLRGTDLLASSELVSVSLGGVKIQPENVEAGTGFYEQKFVRGEIKPEMGQIEMTKSDDGIAWGSIHWQYLEDVSKIEPYEGTPLTLKKSLYIRQNTEKGPVINPVDGPVEVGDELIMRVEVRVDRAMEYVHLKDYRGSGTEPVNVLSRYKYQDGLAYYESTKDTASHFFIDYLPRGTYVFEYAVRVQHRGVYETGIAELQCMYAPEFNSHSGSVEITVK